jgi:F0F1-type ATP synthase beta subunit
VVSKKFYRAHDDLPEGAFYMVGGINEVIEKAKTMTE